MTTEAKQKYTAEFKVVRLSERMNRVMWRRPARELGVKENTLYNQVYQYSRAAKPDKAVRTDEHLYDELKRLKKDVARLMEERDLWTRRQRTLPKKYGSDRMDFGAKRGLQCGIIMFSVVCEPQRVLCVDNSD